MNEELIGRLEAVAGPGEECWSTAELVDYLREYTDEGHQIAATRLEAYEHVIIAALKAKVGGGG